MCNLRGGKTSKVMVRSKWNFGSWLLDMCAYSCTKKQFKESPYVTGSNMEFDKEWKKGIKRALLTLNLSCKCTLNDVNSAYRKLSRLNHPGVFS